MKNFIYEDMSPETAQAFDYLASLEAQEEAEEIRKAINPQLNNFNKILNNLEYKKTDDGYKITVKDEYLGYICYYELYNDGSIKDNQLIFININDCSKESTINNFYMDQLYFIEKEKEILNNLIINNPANPRRSSRSL